MSSSSAVDKDLQLSKAAQDETRADQAALPALVSASSAGNAALEPTIQTPQTTSGTVPASIAGSGNKRPSTAADLLFKPAKKPRQNGGGTVDAGVAMFEGGSAPAGGSGTTTANVAPVVIDLTHD